MIYQRHIPREELFSSQLEMLMQNGRLATVSANLVGVAATVLIFWPFMQLSTILLWAAAFLILLLLRSLQMSNALVERRYQTKPGRVYWQLIIGAALTGVVWSTVYIFAASHVPVTMQYVFLLLIVMITAFSLGFSVAIREYFVVYVFTSLWPIAWWSLAHYWEQPYNMLIGLVLLAFCALLIYVCDQTYKSFRNMISMTWEREHIAQELGDLTSSLRDRNRQLRDARRQLTDLANVDELTGLGNRRLVNSALQEEMNRARRSGGELSLILLDVDYFKNYNDTYGHTAGDTVLQKLADLMQRAATRAGEVVARYGGEEFILVLPGASADSAMRTASRLRDLVNEERIPHETSQVEQYITVSQGVLTVQPNSEMDPTDLVKRVDKALYQAKDDGRNAIAVA
ncbi:MAG: GGDEF domain-containing protein [Gammaproteobacteria bacterium]|nr:MAG: GGDEF domain-containing protein [Gammaproteobacteria bacterium]RLA55226.1 MAG: GGDEF domain-containing protein [Gammaproteobacteria bacterium]